MEARGGTAMRDALSKSIKYVKENGKKDKKVLVVITDGNDNSSNGTLELVRGEAPQRSAHLRHRLTERRRSTRSPGRQAGPEVLGGRVRRPGLYPKSTSDVLEITPRVAHEIRNQYILGYTSSNQTMDGTFRQIKVTVTGFGRPAVRTRNGYYATRRPAWIVPSIAPKKRSPPAVSFWLPQEASARNSRAAPAP